jgi:hypothetical protein
VSKSFLGGLSVAVVLCLSGCASVPQGSGSESTRLKAFPAPEEGQAGVYVYRNSVVGQALKKDVFIDGKCVGESANKFFFYQQVKGGEQHKLSTESEFSPNDLLLYVEAGKNYFVRQVIKMGVFVGGARLEQVTESEGKQEVENLKLAEPGTCS